MTWFVYILLCDQKSFYVGLTNNLQQRIKSHQSGFNIATKRFSDIKLVYLEKYLTRRSAGNRETQLKKWTFAKKKALVDGNIKRLIELSKTQNVANVQRDR